MGDGAKYSKNLIKPGKMADYSEKLRAIAAVRMLLYYDITSVDIHLVTRYTLHHRKVQDE